MKGKTYSNNIKEWNDNPKELWACLLKEGEYLYQDGPLFDTVADAEEHAQGKPNCCVHLVYKNGMVLNLN